MPYAVKFYAYIFVANVLTIVIVARWVKPFGFMASMAFCLAFAYLTIVTGRWVFGKKNLLVARGLKVFLTLVAVVLPIACSPQRSISSSGGLVQIWFLDSAA